MTAAVSSTSTVMTLTVGPVLKQLSRLVLTPMGEFWLKTPPEPVEKEQSLRVTFVIRSSALSFIVSTGEENPSGKVK